MMEDKTLENKFAMHLSGVLSGMSYEKGTSVLAGFCENRVVFNIIYSHTYCSLEEKREDGSGSIFYDMIFWVSDQIESVNIFRQYEIGMFHYQMRINPTADELTEFLDSYEEDYDELSEEEILIKVAEESRKLMEDLDFDEIRDYFENINNVWSVESGDELYYYVDGRQFPKE